MKILITASNNDINGMVEERFGRAPWFIIYDSENNTFTPHDNSENSDRSHAAGVGSSGRAADLGAKVVLTGNIGPKAAEGLNVAGIEAYSASGLSIKDAIEKYKNNELKRL
jgi:predicted Fe-Mo cluster-binding NifX family protein